MIFCLFQVLDIMTQSIELSLGSPQDVEVIPISPTVLSVSWKAPDPIPGSKVTVDKYKVYCSEVSFSLKTNY